MKKSVIWIIGIVVLIILFALAVNYSVGEDGEGLGQSPVIPEAPSKPVGDVPVGA